MPVCRTSAIAILASIGVPVFAQQAPVASQSTSVAETSEGLSEVVVSGVRQAMRDSISTKENTDVISDNISTADIGQLPDVTIAEELNRLPGVNTTRDRGNASQASVRGLGPRLVLGLVDGREIASSEPSQDLRWEIFPSELLSGAVVYKAQDAAIVPGGIAATVDIRTISALDYKGPEFSIRAGPTYNDEGKGLPGYNAVGFRGSAGFVHHLTDDFAVAIAASVQREKNADSDFRTFGWNTPFNAGAGNTGDLNGDGVPDNTTWGLVTEVKEVTQDRYAVGGSAGWRASDALTIKADALWSAYHIQENDYQAWYGNNITGNWQNGNAAKYNAPGNSYSIVNGSVVQASLNGAFPNYESTIARYNERHTLFSTGLNADWKADGWDNSADLSYSDAWRQNRWEAIELSDVFAPNLNFNVTDGQVPSASTPGFNPAAPSLQSVGGPRSASGSNVSGTGESDGPEITQDQIAALALNFAHDLDNSLLKTFKFGGRFSQREKTHMHAQWGLCGGTGSTTFTIPNDPGSQTCPGSSIVSLANAGLSTFNAPGFMAPPMVYGNFDTIRPLVYPNDSQPVGADLLLQRTRVNESTSEGYFVVDYKTTFGGLPLTGDVGARVVHTGTESDGFQTLNGGVSYLPISISNSYSDFLPSLNAVLHLTDDQLLRFGASVGISRPPLDALVTGFSLGTTGTPRTGGGGNPKLNPFKADQLDLSYEWYFHDESLLAIAAYYKDVLDYIGASQSNETIAGIPFIITSENNTKGGEIAGLETTFQTRLFFLPGFLSDFGIYVNHAYAESNIHEATPEPNPFPMVGLATSTTEGDVFYNKGGFEARVAVKNHSAFTVAPTWVGTTLKILEPETTLDASVSQTFAEHWSVRFQGRNLTNERARFDSDNNLQNLSNDGGYQVYGRSYLLDVALRF